LAWKLLEEIKEKVERVSVDFPGAILLMVICSLLIYATNQMPHIGWLDPSVIRILALFVLSRALSIFVERRARRD
jgi:hypothetical protein